MDKKKRARAIWQKTEGNKCAHCGKVCYCAKTVDHFVPRAWGGTSAYANLMPLCIKCNQERDSNPVDPWTFYKFAKKSAIFACVKYKNDWEKQNT